MPEIALSDTTGVLGGRFEIDHAIDEHTLLTRDSLRDTPAIVRLVAAAPDATQLSGAAATVAGLGHGGIAAAIAWGADGPQGRTWIAYDHGDLPTVAERLHDRPWDGPKSIAFAGALAESLAALHDTGIVHGSVTPESVLVGAGDVPVVAVPAPAVVGGPLAPELARTDARPTEASDIYGIGSVLWMLLHGTSYVPGTAMDAQVGPNHDGTSLLISLLADDPRRRPSSARAATGRLRRLGLAFGVPLPDPAATAVTTGAVAVGSLAPRARARGMSAISGALLVAALAVVAAGLGAAYLVTHPGGSGSSVSTVPSVVLPTAPAPVTVTATETTSSEVSTDTTDTSTDATVTTETSTDATATTETAATTGTGTTATTSSVLTETTG